MDNTKYIFQQQDMGTNLDATDANAFTTVRQQNYVKTMEILALAPSFVKSIKPSAIKMI